MQTGQRAANSGPQRRLNGGKITTMFFPQAFVHLRGKPPGIDELFLREQDPGYQTAGAFW